MTLSMTVKIRNTFILFCDAPNCWRVYFENFESNCETDDDVRKQATNSGWGIRGGMDLCPKHYGDRS